MAELTTPLQVRLACRANSLDTRACLALPGYLCVNIVMVDEQYADEFEAFCRANPKPCPLLETVAAGKTDCDEFAEQLDLCTDLGLYDVIRDGEVVESRQDVTDLYNDRMVTFLIGSSVSFDGLLERKGWTPSLPSRLLLTTVQCEPVGRFHGPMVVTVRAFPLGVADHVAEYTSHFPRCHGAPMAYNDPETLGIEDESVDMLGRAIEIADLHDRLYWACGVTPTTVGKAAKLPLMVVHSPGHAMITDIPTEQLYE